MTLTDGDVHHGHGCSGYYVVVIAVHVIDWPLKTKWVKIILTPVLINRGSAVNVILSVSNLHLGEWKGQEEKALIVRNPSTMLMIIS